MAEILTWVFAIGMAGLCIGYAWNALQVVTSNDEFWIARALFSTAALIVAARVLYWGITTYRSATYRFVVWFIAFGVLGVYAVAAIRYVNRKKVIWVVGQTPLSLPKPVFKVTAPTAFPGLVTLDVNLFRKKSGAERTSGIFPVILTFENYPQPGGFGVTETVSAHIRYKQNGMELERVLAGCWVGEALPDITFPFHVPRYLIIGGWHVKSKTPTKDEFRIFEYSRELHRAIEQNDTMASPRALLVEVVLTASSDPTASQEYRFVLQFLGTALFKFYEIGLDNKPRVSTNVKGDVS